MLDERSDDPYLNQKIHCNREPSQHMCVHRLSKVFSQPIPGIAARATIGYQGLHTMGAPQ